MPRNASISSLADFPMPFSFLPSLPMMMPLWEQIFQGHQQLVHVLPALGVRADDGIEQIQTFVILVDPAECIRIDLVDLVDDQQFRCLVGL